MAASATAFRHWVPALAALVCAVSKAAPAGANPDLPLDRPYTQRNRDPALLETEYHRQIVSGGPLSFVFPRACRSDDDTVPGCPRSYLIGLSDSARDQDFGVSPGGGAEYRYVGENAYAGEAGFVLGGHKGPASFSLDARMFAENAEERNRQSYDGESVDTQDESVTGAASYLSYARYRGGLYLDTRVGRFAAAREAAHWGPALMGALAFNQAAVPFNQFTFTTRIGPITVHTLYGDLQAGPASMRSPDKNLYAHRYEWRPGPNWELGITEQLILIRLSKPYLFVPVFPLFIAKGFMHENSNNGNLSFDFARRFGRFLMLYGEFYLDDLESPSSLFLEDYQQNKWAALAGAHYASDWGRWKPGVVFEACRIEPWVYTHFRENPAQASNLDRPLGNPLGPDALDLRLHLYGSGPGGLYLSLTAAATWKGHGRGSWVGDTTYSEQDALRPKEFLAGVRKPALSIIPMMAYPLGPARLETAWTLGPEASGYLRLSAGY